MAHTVRYPYHGTLNGGTGHKRTQPGALAYIFSGHGFGTVVGSGIATDTPVLTATPEQILQRQQAIAAQRARDAQAQALTCSGGGVAELVCRALQGSTIPAPSLTPPTIPAIPNWVQQVIHYSRNYRPPMNQYTTQYKGFGSQMTMPGDAERQAIWRQQSILKTYGVILLKQAAVESPRPNWAESYVEGTYILADEYIRLWRSLVAQQQRVVQRNGGTFTPATAPTRESVRKLWQDSLRPRETVMLARAVPESFRNTATPATPTVVDESIVGRPEITGPTQPLGAKAPKPGEIEPRKGGLGLFAVLAAGAAFLATR